MPTWPDGTHQSAWHLATWEALLRDPHARHVIDLASGKIACSAPKRIWAERELKRLSARLIRAQIVAAMVAVNRDLDQRSGQRQLTLVRP